MMASEDVIHPSSDSFWEVDCYKRTVKRQDDGHKMCTDLMQLINDRGHIEKEYAKALKAWSKKWSDLIDKGSEYGTSQAACKAVMQEAEGVADLHLEVRERLVNDVHNAIKTWRTENYHKSMVGPCKETKELDDGFKKAQKPWAKRYSKVMKARKDYHSAVKQEKTATNQENNSKNDSAVSADALKKIQERVEKCRRDVESTKVKYEEALNDINSYNAKYMEDMTEVFNKCQAQEEKRLKFFKEMLFGIHKCLDLSVNPAYGNIYIVLKEQIATADSTRDLKYWSEYHGVDMAMNWPTFEEYAPEPHTISRKEKKGTTNSEAITLTSVKQNDTPTHVAVSQQGYSNYSADEGTPPPSASSQISQNRYYGSARRYNTPKAMSRRPISIHNPWLSTYKHWDGSTSRTYHQSLTPRMSTYDAGLNPFGEDEDDSKDQQQSKRSSTNNGSAALEEWADNSAGSGMEEVMRVPIRALYDYNGQEEDELSFKSGDVFIKLKDEDDQGWCVGEKDGQVGLFPKDYVDTI